MRSTIRFEYMQIKRRRRPKLDMDALKLAPIRGIVIEMSHALNDLRTLVSGRGYILPSRILADSRGQIAVKHEFNRMHELEELLFPLK